MKKLRNAAMWLYMLNKRQYRRPSFIIMLVLIAVLTAALGGFAKKDSHIMNVAIFAENGNTREFLKEFTDRDSVIGYRYFDSEDDAVEAVTNNGLDAAWIIEDDIDEAAAKFIENGTPIARVVQREDTIFLRITREKLFTVVYPKVSRAMYRDYMHENYPGIDDDYIDKLYDSKTTNDDILEIKLNDSSVDVNSLNHLVSPIRGLLAIAVFLCAYAALMNFKRDRKSGLFARLPVKYHVFAEIASILVAAVNAAIVMLISLKLCGLFTSLQEELLYMALYVLLCVAFCVVFGEFVDNINIISAFMPIISILIIVLCPIFINSQNLKLVKMFLPSYYYLSAFRSPSFVLYGFCCIIAAGVIYIMVRWVKKICGKGS